MGRPWCGHCRLLHQTEVLLFFKGTINIGRILLGDVGDGRGWLEAILEFGRGVFGPEMGGDWVPEGAGLVTAVHTVS